MCRQVEVEVVDQVQLEVQMVIEPTTAGPGGAGTPVLHQYFGAAPQPFYLSDSPNSRTKSQQEFLQVEEVEELEQTRSTQEVLVEQVELEEEVLEVLHLQWFIAGATNSGGGGGGGWRRKYTRRWSRWIRNSY
jgi:hypothetical protein